MITDQAVHALVVGYCVTGMELYYYFFGTLTSQQTFVLAEIEDIARFGEELEIGLHLRCVC